ncbi:MAG: transglutaminase domain-containing protein [Patescibacteria group bacterium]
MPTITVKTDLRRDAWNWWHACNKISHGVDWKQRISKDLQKKLVGKTKKQAYRFLLPYLRELYRKLKIEQEVPKIQKVFNKDQKKIFSRMAKVTGRPIYRQDFTCFLTTFPRGPYNCQKGYVWLPISMQPINVFLHELLHFQTIVYYKPRILKRLPFEQFDALKEALTVILNDKFKDLLTKKDQGYQIHKALRLALKKHWHKIKDFSELIDYGIKIMPQLKPPKITKEVLLRAVPVYETGNKVKYVNELIKTVHSFFDDKKYFIGYTTNLRLSRTTDLNKIFQLRLRTCGAMATVLAFVLRQKGFTVRLVDGKLYRHGRWGRHAWIEVLINKTWRAFDPFSPGFLADKRTHKRVRAYESWKEMKLNI